MLLHRKILLGFVLVACGGSLSVTTGYGLYLRSDSYRADVEAGVMSYLGLPVALGSVRPMGLDSLGARNIRVWLPHRREQVFDCDRAVWRSAISNGEEAFELDLYDGSLVVGTERWRREDYHKIFESGLGQNFSLLGLRRASLRDIDLAWRRQDIDLAVRGVNGTATFGKDGQGELNAATRWLNDYTVSTPIHIDAKFRTDGGLVVEEVALEVPELPLTVLRLDKALDSTISQGVFSGRVIYQEHANKRLYRLSGRAERLLLGELTRRLAIGPIDGELSLDIERARIVEHTVEEIRFRGRLERLLIAPVARLLGFEDFPGTLQVTVHQGAFANNRIESLSVSGRANELSMKTLSDRLGAGEITGRLRAEVTSLNVVGNEITGGELLVEVTPPAGGPGLIDGELLRGAASRLLGAQLPSVLPEKVEYTKLGFRCRLDGAQLYLYGLYGSDRRTILAVRVLGQELPILRQPDEPFDVSTWTAKVRERLDAFRAPAIPPLWRGSSGPSAEAGSRG